jgi:carbonic anhydrase
MKSLPELFSNNEKWRHEIEERHPGFFKALGEQQNPEYLWIGCADSRVPANEVVGMMPGELFVHRNVANLVNHTDLNLLSVLQFAVDVLKVKHIMVVGHYGCGGIKAAMEDVPHGLIDNWLRQVRELYLRNRKNLAELPDDQARVDKMCELNVARHIAMNKQLAGHHAYHFVGWHPGIGTTDPQIFRVLLFTQRLEEAGVALFNFVAPFFIVGKQFR